MLVMLVKRKYNSVSGFVRERGDLTEAASQQDPFSFQQRQNWQLEGFERWGS